MQCVRFKMFRAGADPFFSVKCANKHASAKLFVEISVVLIELLPKKLVFRIKAVNLGNS